MPEIKPHEIEQRLRSGLAPLYLISGDEPLLVEECADHIRKAAHQAGIRERIVFYAERSFQWTDVLQQASSVDMFSPRELIDVRCPQDSLPSQAIAVLKRCLPHLGEDKILILRTARLKYPRKRRPAWFKELTQKGVNIEVWPVGIQEMPAWLSRRLRANNIRMSRDAAEALCALVEGNLLVAMQEIEKLKILGKKEPWNLQETLEAVSDSTRYSPFDLIDEALAGNFQHSLRILHGLHQEGKPPAATIALLRKELRSLHKMAREVESGESLQSVIKKNGVFWKRADRTMQALRRLRCEHIEGLLAQLGWADQAQMGLTLLDGWSLLEATILRLAKPQALSTTALLAIDREIRPPPP